MLEPHEAPMKKVCEEPVVKKEHVDGEMTNPELSSKVSTWAFTVTKCRHKIAIAMALVRFIIIIPSKCISEFRHYEE